MSAPDYAYLDRMGASQIFFPRPDPIPAPPGASDFDVAVAAGVSIAARFYVHATDVPTVLYFHGNGEVASDHDDIGPMFHAIGLNLFVAEFRGYGRSGGRPTFVDLVGDAAPVATAFHERLDEQGFSERRLIMGRSLGSHPALELAANLPERFDAVVIESGASSVSRLLSRLGAADSFAGAELARLHDEKIRSIELPALIIHGEQDELVPVAQAHALEAMLVDSERELVVIPGAGHNDLLWRGRDRYFEAIERLVGGRARR